MVHYQILHYLLPNGRDVYLDWLTRLRDRRAKIAVIRRINQVEQGNFGDHRFLRAGVWELRIDFGPGYRVYYGHAGQRIVLLLGGGTKDTQAADIDRAVQRWQDWNRRSDDEK